MPLQWNPPRQKPSLPVHDVPGTSLEGPLKFLTSGTYSGLWISRDQKLETLLKTFSSCSRHQNEGPGYIDN